MQGHDNVARDSVRLCPLQGVSSGPEFTGGLPHDSQCCPLLCIGCSCQMSTLRSRFMTKDQKNGAQFSEEKLEKEEYLLGHLP